MGSFCGRHSRHRGSGRFQRSSMQYLCYVAINITPKQHRMCDTLLSFSWVSRLHQSLETQQEITLFIRSFSHYVTSVLKYPGSTHLPLSLVSKSPCARSERPHYRQRRAHIRPGDTLLRQYVWRNGLVPISGGNPPPKFCFVCFV